MWTRRDSAGLCWALAALLLVCTRAEAFDPYTVRGFEAGAVAASGAEAKQAALDAAIADGFAVVVERVASEEAARRLAGPEQAMRFLDSLSIQREEVAPTAWRAVLDLRYSAIGVRAFLTRNGVEVVDRPAPPVLVIPVLMEDGIPAAWEAAAPWREALEGADFMRGLTPVVLPRNSREDKRERLGRIMAGDRVTLDTYEVRYRVQGAVVAIAGTTAGRDHVSLRLVGEDAAAPMDEQLEVPGGGLEAAAEALAGLLSERWKASVGGTLTAGTGSGAALPVRVLLHGGPNQWEAIRRKLEASGAVSAVSVEIAGGTAMNVLIWHSGDPAALAGRLAAQGLDLFQAGGAWLLQAY